MLNDMISSKEWNYRDRSVLAKTVNGGGNWLQMGTREFFIGWQKYSISWLVMADKLYVCQNS